MANLQERKGWFHLQFRYQGRQYSQSLDTQERKEAEAIRGSVDRALTWDETTNFCRLARISLPW